MEILNIGPLELIIILIIMFILLGPKDMILTAQRIGRWVRNLVRSPMWREIMGYSQEIRDLPQKIMDETGLQETLTEVKQTTQAAADELNAQLKDVKEAARVPEAEHLRLGADLPGESNQIAPPKSDAAVVPVTVPFNSESETTLSETSLSETSLASEANPEPAAALDSTVETGPASAELSSPAEPVVPVETVETEVAPLPEAAAASTEAVTASTEAVTAPTEVDVPPAEAVTTESAAATLAEPEPKPVTRKPRKRKTSPEDTAPAEAGGSVSNPAETPPAKPRRGRKPKANPTAQPPENAQDAHAQLDVAGPVEASAAAGVAALDTPETEHPRGNGRSHSSEAEVQAASLLVVSEPASSLSTTGDVTETETPAAPKKRRSARPRKARETASGENGAAEHALEPAENQAQPEQPVGERQAESKSTASPSPAEPQVRDSD